jgi:hypothetical protein
MEISLLIVRMFKFSIITRCYNIQPFKISLEWLCFMLISGMASAVLAQDSTNVTPPFFKLVNRSTIDIPYDQIKVNPNMDIGYVNGEMALCFTGVNHKKREIYIQEIRLAENKLVSHVIKFSRKLKLDRRETKFVFTGSDSGQVFMLCSDKLFLLDTKKWKIDLIQRVGENTDFIYLNSKTCVEAIYSRPNGIAQAEIRKVNIQNQIVKKIQPTSGFIEFTHFSPNNLVCFTPQSVFWLNVSRPEFYRYDHDLNEMEKVSFCEGRQWCDADSLQNALPPEKKRAELFERVNFLFENGAFKSWGIQQVNDSTLLVSSSNGLNMKLETLVRIGNGKPSEILSERISDRSGKSENIELFLQAAKGKCYQNKMYYLQMANVKPVSGSDNGVYEFFTFEYLGP